MQSKSLVVGFLVAGCVGAAAGGGYVTVRKPAAVTQPAVTEGAISGAISPTAAAEPSALAPMVTPLVEPAPMAQPVFETEAVISRPPASEEPATPAPVAVPPQPERSRDKRPLNPRPVSRIESARSTRSASSNNSPATPSSGPVPAPLERSVAASAVATPPVEFETEPVRAPEPVEAPEPRDEEVVLPSTSVIGLQVDSPVSSERARVEDRVDARVTRNVSSSGRLAIPAGSRVIGSVTFVERGGKVKERARLGVRFHTLVLADGREIPLRTEAILREGDSPAAESARKIGGAAIGGAILGAIMNGKKGAVLGGAVGAAGGSAAVVKGDRNVATLPAGTIVTVRLTSPATIEVARR